MLNREQWLEKRRGCLGASDVAAVLGADPRRGQLAVYEAKVTGHSTEDNRWMKFGRDIEGASRYFVVRSHAGQDDGATERDN